MSRNPWEDIDLQVYERHMASADVFQLQMLKKIMKEQMQENDASALGICGIAGGNGLDEIDWEKTKKVFAVDINKQYLAVCHKRYKDFNEKITYINSDISKKEFILPQAALWIFNLVIEYIGIDKFKAMIKRSPQIEILSCVVQKNNDNLFVSDSALAKHFDGLSSIEHDISPKELKNSLLLLNLDCIAEKKYILPNKKEFIRMDFRRS